MARFYSLCSGSSGNCTYMGTALEGILIDCGMSAKQITLALDSIGVNLNTLKAIFITHEHSDHIKGLRVFASKNNIKVYSQKGTLNSLMSDGHLAGIYKYEPTPENGIELDTMKITPFATSHDAAESCGYRVDFSDGRSACTATDTGYVPAKMLQCIRKTDLILLESNHDPKMLKYGKYPENLKTRIAGKLGHLSNADCAATALNLLENGTTRFVLGHLSKENNTPELARNTTLSALTGAGAEEELDFLLSVASPKGSGKITIF